MFKTTGELVYSGDCAADELNAHEIRAGEAAQREQEENGEEFLQGRWKCYANAQIWGRVSHGGSEDTEIRWFWEGRAPARP